MTPSRSRRPARTAQLETTRGIGLALAGGGPLGGSYEVGALLALDDSIRGLDLSHLDVYVGVSSGSFVAAALANGVTPSQMYRLFIAEGLDATLKPRLFLRPAVREFARRAGRLPTLAAGASLRWLRDPFTQSPLGWVATLAGAIPTGLFDPRALEAYLGRLFAAPGRTDDFRTLDHKLYLVATHLDTGAPVIFGLPGLDRVPISRAIAASSALPGLFPPVSIDGEHYVDGALNKTLHASLALDEGIGLLFCVNPLVPFRAARASERPAGEDESLSRGGLPRVLAQTFRAVIYSRMHAGMQKYAQQYPDAAIVLLEPGRDDAEVFSANIFGYAKRERICALAYQSTRATLRERAATLAPVLQRHGCELDAARLHDPARTVGDALSDPRPLRSPARRRRRVRDATRELAHALDHLERRLAKLR